MKKQLLYLSLIAATLFLSSCDKEGGTDDGFDYSAQITTSGDVILTTYADLDQKVTNLASTLAALEANPTQQNLEASRQAWREAREPWEKAEGFLFGPVDQQGIDPAIDSWPVNVVDLNAVLASSAALNASYINTLEGTLKGFHTIEWLLFGETGDKAIGSFTAREFEYLAGCSETLQQATAQLYDAWAPEGGNFYNTLATAGSGSAVYVSQKAALEEIINGLVTIADEVANGKINDPFTQQNLLLEESRFSANSKADFADNIRSIKNIWLGGYNTESANGISSVIKEKNADLDARVKMHIDEAVSAIENIPGTFSAAIFNNQAEVQNAQDKVRSLQEVLQSEVLPFISNL